MEVDRGGGFNYEDLYFEMVNRFDEGNFIEIGVYRGGSLSYLAETVKRSGKLIKLWGVDNFSENYQLGKESALTYSKAIEALSPYSDIVTLIKTDSVEAAKKFPTGYFDFIFIDACHEYEAVLEDIKAWYPKLKIGGIIAGHDYFEEYAGVSQAVNEFFPYGVSTKGSCWIKY